MTKATQPPGELEDPTTVFSPTAAALPWPAVLDAHRIDAQASICELNGLRLQIHEELLAPQALRRAPSQPDIRLFRVEVSIAGVQVGDKGQRRRLLYVGEGRGKETVRQFARAIEMADKDAVAGVLPQVVDHWQQSNAGLMLTSDHLHDSRSLTGAAQWRAMGMPLATEMLIQLTIALVWLHEQGISLDGLSLDQLMFNQAHQRIALAHISAVHSLKGQSPQRALKARQLDIAAIGRLLLEVATGRDADDLKPVIEGVLDDAQLLIDAGLARPGLSQLIVGSLIHEAPFGYTETQDLLQGLLQLRAELTPSLSYRTAMASTVGNFPLRRTDQDSCGYAEVSVIYHGISRHIGYYAVADGVGGEEHGERASQAAVHASIEAFHRASSRYSFEELEANPSAIARAIVKVAAQHLAILGEAFPDDHRGATTFTSALVVGDRVGLGHVGDSRVYLLRQGTLHRLTRDHNLSNVKAALREMTGQAAQPAQEDERRISRYLSTSAETPLSWIDSFDPAQVGQLAQAQSFPQGDPSTHKLNGGAHQGHSGGGDLLNTMNIVVNNEPQNLEVQRLTNETRALSASLKLEPGDRLILMSDGLYGEVDDARMAKIMREVPTPQRAARALVSAAMSDLSMDNITALIIDAVIDDANILMAP